MENANSTEYLEKIKNAVIENLKKTGAPSVQMQDVPRQSLGGMTDEDDAELDDLDEDRNKDVRMTQRRWEQKVTRDDEFEESDDEEMAEANGVYQTNGKRKGIMDYKNPHAPDDESRQPSPVVSRAASPAPPAADETENAEGDETMEDVEAAAAAPEPEEPVAVKEAEPEPAPPAAEATMQVDEDGDVDMAEAEAEATTAPVASEAVEPTETPAIKQEEAEAQPSTAAADPTTTDAAEPSEKAADEPAKTDEPSDPPAAEVQDAVKSPAAAAESQEPAEKPASPAKPAEKTEDAATEAKEASPKAESAEKPTEATEKPAED